MPFPENTPGVRDLPGLSAREIAALPVEILAILQREVDQHVDLGKAARARLDDALALRYGDRARLARAAAGKDTGIVRFDDGDFAVVADLPKRVDWNQDQLAAIVMRIRIAGDDPSEYVETSYRVSERKFSAWPEAMRQGFAAARTVRPGALKVELLPQGGDA